jgi:hypothetical protein
VEAATKGGFERFQQFYAPLDAAVAGLVMSAGVNWGDLASLLALIGGWEGLLVLPADALYVERM